MPPYGPKWPRASGKSYICISDLCDESDDLRGVLDALRRFHAARHVHAPGPYAANGLGDVRLREPAGQDYGSFSCGNQGPVEALAHSAVLRHVAVEEPGRGARKRAQVF